MKTDKPKVVFFQRKPRSAGNFSVEIIFDDVRFRLSNQIALKTYYSTYESTGFFKRLYNCLEVIFNQGEVNHVTGDINYIGMFLKKGKTIHTILDCVFLDRSAGWKHRILKLFWLTIPISRSTYITAISESTKSEILKYSGCDPDKIVVIPVAISERFSRNNKPFNKEKPIILQIGTAPNKNIPRLIEALRGINCQLHIVGKYNEEYERLVKEAAIDYVYESGLTEEQIIGKYQLADIISFASTYEGFGMPILEGQTTGRVVVTSRILSMPEVAGDAACLVDPFDENSIREAMRKVIEDDEYRNDLIRRGFENIKRYQPEKIANQYLDLYLKVFDNNKNGRNISR
jgi:glycosyltransferase involved in cell wall biosynthesis